MMDLTFAEQVKIILSRRAVSYTHLKAISRRTSYLRVRLEFLPYPHLIPTLFNGCGFGPPLPCLLYTSSLSASPQFCYRIVQEFQPVIHRLRLSTSPQAPTYPGQILSLIHISVTISVTLIVTKCQEKSDICSFS